MGNYTIFLKFENRRRGRQARNLSENDPKILDLKSDNCRWVPLITNVARENVVLRVGSAIISGLVNGLRPL